MGRRINISQPTVIKTELPPLTDLFDIDPSDTLEQWFYSNSGEYKPNRQLSPLVLTPRLSAVDETTGLSYRPSIASIGWYYLDPANTATRTDKLWPGKGWVYISATADGSGVDWYVQGYTLIMKKNVVQSSPVTLCCVVQYTDPRDSGTTVMVRSTVQLTTNTDATVETVTVVMNVPPSQKMNVFRDASLVSGEYRSPYVLSATVLSPTHEDVTGDYYVEWYGRVNGGSEVKLDTLLCYTKATQATGKGQGTGTVTVDMMFAERLDVTVRLRKTRTSAVLPSVGYASLVWDLPRMDCYTATKNGSAVSNVKRDLTFETIVNIKGDTLTDAQKAAHLQMNYKSRVSTSQTVTDRGWGQTVTIGSDALKQTVSKSTPVHSEVYLQGAFEVVTCNGEDVTYDGEVVYDRG